MAANPVRLALSAALAAHAPLAALVGTRIYFQQAPQDATFPFVVFHKQSGTQRHTLGGDPTRHDTWTVKGVSTGSGSASKAEEIDAACEDAIAGVALTVTDRDLILRPMRQGDIDYAEVKDGNVFRHCGGMYRVITE